jgi:uracil-DNA glycosylase
MFYGFDGYSPFQRSTKDLPMRVSDCVECANFPCRDVRHQCYLVPDVELSPELYTIVLISEAAPLSRSDYYYGETDSQFQRTTVQAFNDAGAAVASIQDILDRGVYLTTAVKCGKTGYNLSSATIEECSLILEKELELFPNIRVLLLMGDVAIRAINFISRRAGLPRTIPASPTYKLRGREFFFQGKRIFPSYLQAGPSFYIEKSKRTMIAEDINGALQFIR